MKAPGPAQPRIARIPALDGEVAEEVAALWWPMQRLAEGLEALARESGLLQRVGGASQARPPSSQAVAAPEPPALVAEDPAIAQAWLDWNAQRLGLECSPLRAQQAAGSVAEIRGA